MRSLLLVNAGQQAYCSSRPQGNRVRVYSIQHAVIHVRSVVLLAIVCPDCNDVCRTALWSRAHIGNFLLQSEY